VGVAGTGRRQQTLHHIPDYSAREKISDDNHLFVRDADHINAIISSQIENNVLALWKVVIAFSQPQCPITDFRLTSQSVFRVLSGKY